MPQQTVPIPRTWTWNSDEWWVGVTTPDERVGFEKRLGDLTRKATRDYAICSEEEEFPRLGPRIRKIIHTKPGRGRIENVEHYLQPSGVEADRSTHEIKSLLKARMGNSGLDATKLANQLAHRL